MIMDMGMGIVFVGEKQMNEFLRELLQIRLGIPMNPECRRFLDGNETPRRNWKDAMIAAMFPGEKGKGESDNNGHRGESQGA